jgi:pyridoxal phosphate enzyme (YggS family)
MYERILNICHQYHAELVTVSKTKPTEEILKIYHKGQRDFGENRAQEMAEKHDQMPKDIHWHFIGHLQSKKVKYIAPFVYLIHSVDRPSLLETIDKEAKKNDRTIDILIQPKIAKEETKSGASEEELESMVNELMNHKYTHINLRGLMGMATFTEDTAIIEQEFSYLKSLFDKIKKNTKKEDFTILSMGMSGDYELALKNGSSMIRVGSLIFGKRNYN